MNKDSHLIWIDLEMTGLVPEKDHILEIASVITDDNLQVIADGPNLVIHHDQSICNLMNEWGLNQHTHSGLLNAVRESDVSLEQAAQQTLDFLQKYCLPGVSPLCGNSVWQDRAFMRVHMPRIIDFLHYRTIDVTSFKEVITRWYPKNPHAQFAKKDKHRSLDDIYESIAELRHYRRYFFVEP